MEGDNLIRSKSYGHPPKPGSLARAQAAKARRIAEKRQKRKLAWDVWYLRGEGFR